jgi:hypothetical protein
MPIFFLPFPLFVSYHIYFLSLLPFFSPILTVKEYSVSFPHMPPMVLQQHMGKFLTIWTASNFSRSTQLHQDTTPLQNFPVWTHHLATDIRNAIKHCVPTLWRNKHIRLLVPSQATARKLLAQHTFTLWWSSMSCLIKHHKSHDLFSEEQDTHTQPHKTASWWANTICIKWEDAEIAPHSGATAITNRQDTHIHTVCLSCVWGKPHHDMQGDYSRSLNICSRWIFHPGKRNVHAKWIPHMHVAACTNARAHTHWLKFSVCAATCPILRKSMPIFNNTEQQLSP